MSSPKLFSLRFFLALLLTGCRPLLAQTPEWIWLDNQGAAPADNEVRFFRKTFAVEGPVSKAVISVAADNEAVVFINSPVFHSDVRIDLELEPVRSGTGGPVVVAGEWSA